MAERRRLPVTCAPMVLFMTAFCALSVFQSLLLQELRLRERCGFDPANQVEELVVFVSGGAWIIGNKAWAFLMGQTLQRNGVDGSTVVVFHSDHGYSLGERNMWCKSSPYTSAVSKLVMPRSSAR